ncbi:MAG: hypothetical protein IJ112_00240 [Oscillospiraceae bacterium]|nr:hypothetical protein [Oscillospiraceae bacterium]
MPKDKLHAYYEDLAPSPELPERLKALRTAPRKPRRSPARVVLPIAAVLALALLGALLRPRPSDVIAPGGGAAPVSDTAVPASDPVPPAADTPAPAGDAAAALPTATPSLEPPPTAEVPQTTAPMPPDDAPTVPGETKWENSTSGSGSPAPNGPGVLPDAATPELPEGACPVTGAYARVDGRDLIALWSVMTPEDAELLDVTDQLRDGRYAAELEHGGVTVAVQLTLNPDGSYTLTVD